MVGITKLSLLLVSLSGALAAPALVERDPPDFELVTSNLTRRQDYNQNYKTGGTVNYTPSSNGYSVTFSGAADFVVGKGWKTGSARTITFSGSTTASAGTVKVACYGWTTNPLVEYYIQDYSTQAGASHGDKVGTVTSDGGTYDIWKHQQVNQPSIQGTNTFWQYLSVRQSMRPGGGTITTKNHFDAWNKAGLKLGTHSYQTISTEAWGSAAGSSKYTVSGS